VRWAGRRALLLLDASERTPAIKITPAQDEVQAHEETSLGFRIA